MAFFSDEELEALEIERMVFHLVGPLATHFVRLEEVDPGDLRGFFLDRIRSANGGARYAFSDASATRERLSRIVRDSKSFQVESEGLAQSFQEHHGGAAARGAFLVFVVKAGAQRLFALLKFDDEKVVSYQLKDGKAGRKRVDLSALESTFVQNRDALQKAALVRLTKDGGDLTVLDRQNQQKVARYFENFLDAHREQNDAQLTKALVETTRRFIRDNKDLVPEEVHRNLYRRTYEAATSGADIAVDGHQGFLETVLGKPLPKDDPLVSKFSGALKKARLDATPMKLDAGEVAPPRARRITTVNRIQINVPIEMKDLVVVEKDRIIINDPLESDRDDSGPAR